MAEEYKLPYSGDEIKRILGSVDPLSNDVNTLNEEVLKLKLNSPTVYDGTHTIGEDNAKYDNCIFNDMVTIEGDYVTITNCVFNQGLTIGTANNDESTGNYAHIINCTFYNSVKVNGRDVQLKNIYIGGTAEKGSINGTCLLVYPTAKNIIVSDFVLTRSWASGIYYNSYGGCFSNFEIYRCYKTGIHINAGGVQMQNGKIYFCGAIDYKFNNDDDKMRKGGLLAKAIYGSLKHIPELCIDNVSIQQNFGFGMHLYDVTNSTINVTLMSNYSDFLNGNMNDAANIGTYVNANGVCISPRYTYRDYGVKLIGCKNVSGSINGISCHSHWWGADKGYYDDIPSLNNINVTWESTYTNNDSNNAYYKNPKIFSRFLPEVHAEIVNGLRIGSQLTEADCSSTTLDYANIPMISDTGELVENKNGRMSIDLGTKVPISKTTKKAMIRLYVEAPNLNIYPYIRIMNANWVDVYRETKDTLVLNNVMARGQHGVYSGTFCYDVGDVDLATASYFYLYIFFNKVDETLTGTVTPKIRVQYYPY